MIAVPALFHGAVRRSARRQLAEGHNRGVLGLRRLEIRDDFLVELSELGEQHTRWRAVEKVVVAPGHVFIYLSATAGHTLPRGAFSDEAALQAFVGLLRGRSQGAAAAGL